MVKVFTSHHTFTHTWEDVTYGLLRKYPNPLSSHVLACDTIARRVDPQTGTLISQRLLKKTNNKPKLAEKLLGKQSSHGYVLEDSTIDPRRRTMTTVTRNLSFARVMVVEEICTYRVSAENPEWTECVTEARVTCPLWGWARPVEGFGVERFKQNLGKAREALEHVIKTVIHPEKHLMGFAPRPSQSRAADPKPAERQ